MSRQLSSGPRRRVPADWPAEPAVSPPFDPAGLRLSMLLAEEEEVPVLALEIVRAGDASHYVPRWGDAALCGAWLPGAWATAPFLTCPACEDMLPIEAGTEDDVPDLRKPAVDAPRARA